MLNKALKASLLSIFLMLTFSPVVIAQELQCSPTELELSDAKLDRDCVLKKPAGELSWGELLREYFSYDGYSRSHALVIGVSAFDHFEPLPTEQDPIKVAKFLYDVAGYDHVRILTESNVTEQRIKSLISDFYKSSVDTNDRFLVYWSGHGHTLLTRRNEEIGYLPLKSASDEDDVVNMIEMGQLRDWVDRWIDAEQVLYLFDACFSGHSGVVGQSLTSDQSLSSVSKPSRQILTASAEAQQTFATLSPRGGAFTRLFLEGATGRADRPSSIDGKRDGIVTASELSLHIREGMLIEQDRHRWTKDLNPQLYSIGSVYGDFFFLSKFSKEQHLAERNLSASGEYGFGIPLSASSSDDTTNKTTSVPANVEEINPTPEVWTYDLSPPGFQRSVDSITASPNGERLVAVSSFSGFVVRDANTLEALQVVDEPSVGVSGAFSPDGSMFAVALRENGIAIWETANWSRLPDPRWNDGDQPDVNAVAFSPDGTQIYTSRKDNTVWRQDFDNPSKTFIFGSPVPNLTFGARSLAISSDNSAIAVLDEDYVLSVWNTDGSLRFAKSDFPEVFNLHNDTDFRRVAFSPNNNRIAVGLENGAIAQLNSLTGDQIFEYQVHREFPVTSLSYYDDDRILSGGIGWGLIVSNPNSGSIDWYDRRPHDSSVYSVVAEQTRDPQLVFSSALDGSVKAWQLSSGDVSAETSAQISVQQASLSANGNILVTTSDRGHIKVWDLDASLKLINSIDDFVSSEYQSTWTWPCCGAIDQIALSHNGELVAVAVAQTLSIISTRDGQLLNSIKVSDNEYSKIDEIKFQSDDQALFVVHDSTVKLLLLPSLNEDYSYDSGDDYFSILEPSLTGNLYAAGNWECCDVEVRDIGSQHELGRIKLGKYGLSQLRFARDAKSVTILGYDKLGRYSVDGTTLSVRELDEEAPHVLSDFGRYALSHLDDGSVEVRDVETSELISKFDILQEIGELRAEVFNEDEMVYIAVGRYIEIVNTSGGTASNLVFYADGEFAILHPNGELEVSSDIVKDRVFVRSSQGIQMPTTIFERMSQFNPKLRVSSN